MSRIQVEPDRLAALAVQVEAAAQQLHEWNGRLGRTLASLDWEGSQREQMTSRAAAASRGAATLADQAEAMAHFLRLKARAFAEADAGGVERIGDLRAPFGQLVDAAVAAARQSRLQARLEGDQAGIASVHRHEETLRSLGAVDSVGALLAQVFPRPEEQMILRHTMQEEGPGKFGAAWGAVVYRPGNGAGLVCDRQWLNFGLISFAMPSGTAGGVLRRLFNNPNEATAFRALAVQHLADHPGGTVPAGWRHLLDHPSDVQISPLSGAQMADHLINLVQAGEERAERDWLFKYMNEPAERSGVATGTLRADWAALFDQFLSRPESQMAQLEMAKNAYVAQAVTAAERFGLSSVRGVGFMFDLHVQHGGPPAGLLALAQQDAYKALPEPAKLVALRDAFGAGSTAWHRRDAVIRSDLLVDDPYPGLPLAPAREG